MERLRLNIRGAVQGVGFRYFACRQARVLGLFGWVKNLPGGGVALVAEGPRERLQKILDWCYTGVGYSRVDRIDAVWEDATGEYEDFIIRT